MGDMETVATCGLFCEACSVFIATQNGDQAALEAIAKKMGVSAAELRCNGCRSQTLGAHCRTCEFRACADRKGIANCEDCGDFPCAPLREFQVKMPHRIELFESARHRREHGLEKWKQKMHADYACGSCGTLNSPYFLKCKQCGAMPGNPYIARNLGELRKYLKV